jgi:hypothetical protein
MVLELMINLHRTTTLVLNEVTAKGRAKIMAKLTKIAAIIHDSNNFNTLMAILGGINTSSIIRLTHTRRIFETMKEFEIFQQLEKIMGSDKSFREYRTSLKRSESPCIPYLYAIYISPQLTLEV